MKIAVGKVLTEDEVFELVSKNASTIGGSARDAFHALAKSHEALRQELSVVREYIEVAHIAMGNILSRVR